MESNTKITISIRLAKRSDSLFIWRIRNHPLIRKHSHNTLHINFAAHTIWFNNFLKIRQNKLYVLENTLSNNIIGYCRYDFHKDHFVVSIALDINCHNKGYGALILSETLKKVKKYHLPIYATVKKENIPSQKLFQRINFTLTEKGNQEESNVLNYLYIPN